MRFKKFINWIAFIRLTLKNLGFNFFVPYFFLFVVTIFMTYTDFLQGFDKMTCYSNTYVKLQFFCPFFAIWWTVFGFREYIEGKGREILLVYKKSIIFELLAVFAFYLFHIFVLLSLYYVVFDFNYFNFFFIFFAQAFTFFSVCVSLSILLKSIAVPFIISIIYEIFCMSANVNFLKYINILSENIPTNIEQIFIPYIFTFIGGLIMLIISNFRFKRL